MNVFRFQYFLLLARQSTGLPIPSIDQLRRWIIFSLKWPELARWIKSSMEHAYNFRSERSITLASKRLQLLEETFGKDFSVQESWRSVTEEKLGFKESETRWFTDENLRQFFKEEADLPVSERLSASTGKGLY